MLDGVMSMRSHRLKMYPSLIIMDENLHHIVLFFSLACLP